MSFPILPDSLQHLLLHTSPSLIAFCRTHLGGVNRDATALLGQAGGRHGASELEPGPCVIRSASAEPEGRKSRGPAPLLGRAARLRLPVCASQSAPFSPSVSLAETWGWAGLNLPGGEAGAVLPHLSPQ